ncbi:MAG TPA: STAS/SEC14 domain-containing protein [Phycisphaerales bacterium]|nr:STAS/SEC14 domain-containing protein [Phycisphaerales bacterium]
MQVLAPPAPHVVSLDLSGKLTRADIQSIMETLEESLETQPRVSVLADLTGMTGMTAAALLQDFKNSLENLTRLHRFYRIASVADNSVIDLLANLDSRTFSGLELKNFKPHEYEAALRWVEQRPPIPERRIETTEHIKDSILEVTMESGATAFDLHEITDRIRNCYERRGPVKVLLRVSKLPNEDFNFWLEQWQSLKALKLVSQLAIVGDEDLRPLVDSLNMAVQASLHLFGPADYPRALRWLSESQEFLQTYPTTRDSLVFFRINGKVKELDLRGMVLTVVSRLKGENSLDVLIEIPHYDGTSLKALLSGLRLTSVHLEEMMSGVRRVALITDSQWLNKALHLEDILFTGIEERAFPFHRREEALRWLDEGRC